MIGALASQVSTSLCQTPSARFGEGVARDFRSRSISGRDTATTYNDAKNTAEIICRFLC